MFYKHGSLCAILNLYCNGRVFVISIHGFRDMEVANLIREFDVNIVNEYAVFFEN